MKNIFDKLPLQINQEESTSLHELKHTKITRIVSPVGCLLQKEFYDQADDEWFVILQGSAILEISGKQINLTLGSHYFIPAHTKHRVIRTSPSEATIWLAIYCQAEN